MTTAAHLDAAIARTCDFPDAAPPFLVKQLRDALRSGIFVWSFMSLALTLGLVAIWGVARSDDVLARQILSAGLSWGVLIPLFVLKPLQALMAVRQERRARTLELLVLTRTRPWNIILGKWYSLEAQAAIYLVALVPFFLLRYFFGRCELLAVAGALVLCVVMSAFLTVLCLAASSLSRVGFPVAVVLLVLLFPLWMAPNAWLVAVLRGAVADVGFSHLLVPPLVVGVPAFVFGFIAIATAASRLLPDSRDSAGLRVLPPMAQRLLRPLLRAPVPPLRLRRLPHFNHG